MTEKWAILPGGALLEVFVEVGGRGGALSRSPALVWDAPVLEPEHRILEQFVREEHGSLLSRDKLVVSLCEPGPADLPEERLESS